MKAVIWGGVSVLTWLAIAVVVVRCIFGWAGQHEEWALLPLLVLAWISVANSELPDGPAL